MDSERKEFEAWWYEHGLGPMDAQREAWQARAELDTPHATEKLNALHVNHIALQAECETLRKCKAQMLDALWKASGDNLEAVSGYLESVGLSLDAMGKERA